MLIFLLLCFGVFGWTEVKHGECAEWHHKDYMFNTLNEQYTRASDKIDQCERWCLRDDDCKSFALWFADHDEADGKAAYCSLCATDKMNPRPASDTGGWYWHSIDETERITDCQDGGIVERHMCICGTTDCPHGSYCESGQCVEACDYGLVTGETCVCEAQKCEQGFFCDSINQQCVSQCPRSKCNNHGQDSDPTDGCDSCECDRHFYGDRCQYTDYKSIKEMKLAFCHPVLFGKTNVTRLDTFLDYYRRIGFDRFYFWSEPNDEVEQFFAKQNDVTFRIYNEAYELQTHGFFEYPPNYGGGDKDWYHGQNVAIHSCMKLTQQEGFDWVQFGDSDEFVYFTGNEDIRSFLARFHRFSYVSLGKMMYSRSYCAEHGETPNDLFDLLYRPDSPFCSFEDNNLHRSYEYCETFFGRRKYIIQPQLVSKLQIHEPVLFEGLGLDLSTDVAHIKELRGYNNYIECEHVLSESFVEISDEHDFQKSMHGDISDFNTYQVQIRHNTTIVTMIRDNEFNEWLHHLYELPYTQPPAEKLYHEFDHVAAFKEFYERSLENPCSNDAVLFQFWDVCGFGCATNTLVLQILDAYFRGQTFSFSRQHSDYQRYFRFIFEDKAFPICDEENDMKPRVQPINPHVFYKTHIHHGRRENALRPLFHHIYHDILWSSLKPVLQDEIEARFSENPQLGEFTAIHVRRGDKCIEEAHCVGFDKYYEHVSHKEQPIFLMTDALMEVATEIEDCCSEIKDHIYTLDENLNKDANTRAWDDGSSFIDLIVEISMAGRAESVVCSGSSNLCRLLWALTDTETEIFNMDTKSMLCGDARDVACMAPGERQTTYSGHQFKQWLGSLPENLSKFASDLEMMSSVETVDDKLLDSIGVEDDSSRTQLKEAFEKEMKLNVIEDHLKVILDTPGSHIRRNLQNGGSVTTNPPEPQQPLTCDDNLICFNNGDVYYDSAAHACACTCYAGYGGTNCAYKWVLSHQYVFDNTLEEFNSFKDDIAALVASNLALLNARRRLQETPTCIWTVNNFDYSYTGLSSATTALLNCGFVTESEFTSDDTDIWSDTDAYETPTIAAIEAAFPTITVTDIWFYHYCNAVDNCSSNGITTDDDPTDGCTCQCNTGFGGDDCSVNILCSNTDCNNAGSTVDVDNTDGCTCSCYPGYYGDNCEITSSCVRSSNQIGYSHLSTSSSSTIDGTDLSLVISVPIDLDVQFIEFHNALDTGYDYPDASSMWAITEPTEFEDCSREYTWSGSIVDLLAKFDTNDLRYTATTITFDISVEGTTVVPLSDGSYYDRSSATIVPVQVNLASNAVVQLTMNTITDAAPITAVVTLYEVTDTYLIRMTISLYSLFPYSISNVVDLDGSTLPSSYSYGDVTVSGDSVTCVENQECSTEFVVTISPSSCSVTETLLFDFRASNSIDNSIDVSQNEFVITADFCDTFLGTLDGLSGDITLYDENPTSASLTPTSTLYVAGTMYATVSLSSTYATIASMSLTSVSLSNDGNVYSVATSGTDLTYTLVDQQADVSTISIVLDDTYITGSLAGVTSTLSIDVDVTYSTNGRRLLGLENDSEMLTINYKFELVEEVCGKDTKKGDVDVHECSKGVNIRQCHESGWITIVNNCVHVSE